MVSNDEQLVQRDELRRTRCAEAAKRKRDEARMARFRLGMPTPYDYRKYYKQASAALRLNPARFELAIGDSNATVMTMAELMDAIPFQAFDLFRQLLKLKQSKSPAPWRIRFNKIEQIIQPIAGTQRIRMNFKYTPASITLLP